MGLFRRAMRVFETEPVFGLGARAAILLRENCGPTGDDSAQSPTEHLPLHRYAAIKKLALDSNMLVARDNWLVVNKKRILVSRPGAFTAMPSDFHWEIPLKGSSVAWLEHSTDTGEPLVMLHFEFADGRFILGNVHLDDDGDCEGFINAMPNSEPIDAATAQTLLHEDD